MHACMNVDGKILTLVFQMALEEYIKQVKETWTSYTLDLVIYQNKTRLIRSMLKLSLPS